MTAKILMIDIEVAPNTAHCWGLFDQNISLNQIIESSYALCYAAKWYGEDEVLFDSVYKSSKKKMLKGVHKLLDEADAVIHYNGKRFDIPILNKEFLLSGMPPPSPSKQIDLLQVAKQQFRFVSNKLDYVSKALGLGKKTEHMGHELWIRCMNKDQVAWKLMEEYNINDVILLEKVYEKFKPWIKYHLNLSTFSGDQVCPNCGGHHYQRRGYAYTAISKFQRYQCTDCGFWFRGNKNLREGSQERFVGVA